MYHFLLYRTLFSLVIALSSLLIVTWSAVAAAQKIAIPNSVPAEKPALLAPASSRDAQRQEMKRQRAQLQKQRAQEEAACSTKFQRNDCLADVRKRYRGPLLEMRRKELTLNEEERKLRGEEQLRLIEERKEKAGLSLSDTEDDPVGEADGQAPFTGAAPARALSPEHGDARQQEAKKRAQQQRQRVENKKAENTARETNSTERERIARQRYEIKLRKAEEHKTERTAQSKTTRGAAGLPVPP